MARPSDAKAVRAWAVVEDGALRLANVRAEKSEAVQLHVGQQRRGQVAPVVLMLESDWLDLTERRRRDE